MRKKQMPAKQKSMYQFVLIPLIGLIVLFSLDLKAMAKEFEFSDIVKSANTNDLHRFQVVAMDFNDEQKNLAEELLKILNDTKEFNFNRCAATYYLGEIHATNAVDKLASEITLQLNFNEMNIHALPIITKNPTVEALVKIGNPSIPAVIRNLAESDDAKVRELSLKVLNQIEGDKDIVQLRLQKALTAEKDSKKQARLQAALKELDK